MIISQLTVAPQSIRVLEQVGAFSRLATTLTVDRLGTGLIDVQAHSPQAQVEWLAPFSWDAGLRGVRVLSRLLRDGDRLVLHSGPYATADAVAALHGMDMRFPDGGEGHRYTSVDEPAPDAKHQDAAGWVVADIGGRCLVVAWDFSGTVSAELHQQAGRLRLAVQLPLLTGPDSRYLDGPEVWLAVVDGGLDQGADALRELIMDRFVTAPDLSGMPGRPEFPCLVANSWGVGEDTSTDRILAMMDATALVGTEVFVLDKGWERSVGDWHANERFPTGLTQLSDAARERGMGFGVWCGFGNADPRSPVARDHPDWLAAWRGTTRQLSFDNYGLCLGHDPARVWVLGELRRMVHDFRLTWLIHDFETMARCDRADHTHGAGGGDRAAEAAWHHVLGALKAEFPLLVLENCWNGGRPLDLGMVRSHHTTITEDHCRVHWNALAKVALGRYLPLDWQSAYMGVGELPSRARIAPYVIGGPWILMDDPATWDAAVRTDLTRAAAVYKAWRGALRTASVARPDVDVEHAHAVQASVSNSSALLAVSVPPGHRSVTVSPVGVGDGQFTLIDEWTGSMRPVVLARTGLQLPVQPEGDGLLFSLSRAEVAPRSSPREGTAGASERVGPR